MSSSWHARDVSFKHPIKIYLGARYGSPRKIQKLRIYRNSHLIGGTTQEISDAPYGDYFCMEEFWDVERIGDGSRVRIYINVAFSKNTMCKGKIVQSTMDECRDAYATWIAHAHDLFKQTNMEKEGRNVANSIANGQVHVESQEDIVENLGASQVQSDLRISDSCVINQDSIPQQENFCHGDSAVSFLRGSVMKLGSYFKSYSQFPSVVVIIVVAIFLLMQSQNVIHWLQKESFREDLPQNCNRSMGTVKLQEEKDTQVTIGINITGENFDTTAENLVEEKKELSSKSDDALMGKKKNMLLSLDYEGVISAWADKKMPWVIGDGIPELDLNDRWPDCIEIVNDRDGKDYTDSSEDEYEVGEAEDNDGDEDEPLR